MPFPWPVSNIKRVCTRWLGQAAQATASAHGSDAIYDWIPCADRLWLETGKFANQNSSRS